MRFLPILFGAFALAAIVVVVVPRPSSRHSSVSRAFFSRTSENIEIGVGVYDVTGPAAEVNMMGYAVPNQVSAGIHIRTFSRAFVFRDPSTSKHFAFVSFDGGMASDLVNQRVVEKLNAAFPGVYSYDNICISGTHTHSAPAGFLQYTLFQITSLGFVRETFDAFVNGIAQSIIMAHKNLAPASAFLAEGLLAGANINRSPFSYMANPEDERRQYLDVGNDTDHTMVLVKVTDPSGNPVGMLNWFAVHGTSMNHTNRLISGDNKGYASLAVEKRMNPGAPPGVGPFVAAFAQTNLGDVSPNTLGPRCLDTGLPCDLVTSTCNGRNELCVAFGPGKDMFESTQIIGQKQVDKAMELFQAASTPLRGPVDYIHQFVHMPSQTVNGKTLCSPAMGYAFAAGTTDGCGMFDFKQGSTSPNPFWNAVSNLLAKPSQATIDCHAPKPILLDTGDVSVPYLWDPNIVPLQILRVGQLVIISVPGEFTTMAGRRLRNAVKRALVAKGVLDSTGTVVIAGLANSYSSYIATFEEYQVQRYEAASTIYGPHTLEAYIQKYVELAEAMADGRTLEAGPTPPDFQKSALSFLPPVIVDGTPHGSHFGAVVSDAQPSYRVGSRVSVTFQSANPRNNLRTQGTFLSVEQKQADDSWVVVAVDADWETQYRWYRQHFYSDESFAEIVWDIPPNCPRGTYRIRHFGDSKSIFQTITPFSGSSSPFTVTD